MTELVIFEKFQTESFIMMWLISFALFK